ncbi:poly [ADP-ribose] polymerase 2-like [Styela clava]
MPPRKRQTKAKGGKKANTANSKQTTSARGKKRKDTAASVVPDVPTKKEKIEVKEEASSITEEKGDLKKLKFTGSVPVDEACIKCSKGYHVFEKDGFIYNAMLNQTNIGANNNKYYILQVLENDEKNEYISWFRWGRVGKVAGKSLKNHGSNFGAATWSFNCKFSDKTRNRFCTDNFVKQQGFYDLVEMDYGESSEKDIKRVEKIKEEHVKAKPEAASKLDKRVQDVMQLIFDIKEFEACVKELEFDVKKAPLGKLTAKQIKAGYETLKKIEGFVLKKNFGEKLSDACSEFYTKIPHDFGMKVPTLIKTTEQIEQKVQLLESLSDIQIAIDMIEEDKAKAVDDVNIKDRYYQALGCKLEPFDKSDPQYKLLEKYITNSRGSRHNYLKIDVDDIYKVEREGEEKRFKKNIGNRMLLWHGSRLTNWCGILKQGLRIAPPEAPISGHSFGKGVYFADIVTKSAHFCCTNARQPNAFLLLCEVALGDVHDEIEWRNRLILPKGKLSTKAVGEEGPDPKGFHTMECGTVIPMGKAKKFKRDKHRFLEHSEYVVFDVAQIKARYLVKAKIHWQQ